VDFFGSYQRPAQGVLSESHINSLAIALFLSMAETFNTSLDFLVLDDVVNSFDAEHRGSLARMLADGFTDSQLIVLTHDRLFFDQIWRRGGAGWRRLEFTSWSYAEGPRMRTSEPTSAIAEAQSHLPDDPAVAAGLARKALEGLLQEIAEEIQAPLPFKRGMQNDRREIGELMKGLRRQLKENDKAFLAKIEPLLGHLDADVAATLNVEAHASTVRASCPEVAAAIKDIADFDQAWRCPTCETRFWQRENQCKCGRCQFPPLHILAAE
jgi:hypothetical protein